MIQLTDKFLKPTKESLNITNKQQKKNIELEQKVKSQEDQILSLTNQVSSFQSNLEASIQKEKESEKKSANLRKNLKNQKKMLRSLKNRKK